MPEVSVTPGSAVLHLLIFPNSLVVFHHHVDEGGGIQSFALQIELEHLEEGWGAQVSVNQLSAPYIEDATLYP